MLFRSVDSWDNITFWVLVLLYCLFLVIYIHNDGVQFSVCLNIQLFHPNQSEFLLMIEVIHFSCCNSRSICFDIRRFHISDVIPDIGDFTLRLQNNNIFYKYIITYISQSITSSFCEVSKVL